MKWPYVIALYTAAAMILGCITFSILKTKKNPIEHAVRRLLFCAAAALGCYATAVALPVAAVAHISFSLYNCCIDAMVVSLLYYVRCYTGIMPKRKTVQHGIFGAMLLDWLFMLTNPLTGLVYTIAAGADSRSFDYYYIAERGVLYPYHLAFVYITMLLLMSVLIRKIKVSPRIYKTRYITILSSLCIVLALHITYLKFSFDFDYSLFFYVIIAFSVFYFSLVYIPKGLIEKILFCSVSNMEDGFVCLDIDGKCVHANQAARRYCTDASGVCDLDGRIRTWYDAHPDMEAADINWDAVQEIDGKTRYYSNESKRMFDEQGRYLGCFFILHDRTEEQLRLAEEQYRATHDPLTGILNKEAFYESAARMLAEHPDREFCIVGTDIKNFKLINDMFGVETGDAVLKRAADLIASFATECTVYGRLTADRFAILMLRERISEELFLGESAKLTELLNNSVFRMHVHFGIYDITDPNVKVSLMCDRAFLAIRSIKDSYENIIAYYDRSMRDSFITEHKVISEFEQALSEGQFHAFIQPQISVDGSIHGGEALVRWIHPEEGLVPPFRFISIFERTGLISRLDPYIWELACKQLRKWHAEGHADYYISVNISPKDFMLIDVYETLVTLVERYKINPRSLHLEITETAVMENPKEQLPLINRLRSYGFIVEIDDFGSGYSSLNTLKDLSADVLKIDMGFLSKTGASERSLTILKMIIALAKSLEMEVITEGVETREQVDFLTEFGCDVFQGYYFAKPMQVSDFETQYLKSSA